MRATELAKSIYAWAQENGYVVGYDTAPPSDRVALSAALHRDPRAEDRAAEQLLSRVEITGVLADDSRGLVTVLASGHLGPRNSKVLPEAAEDVQLDWIGSAQIQHNPQPLPAQPPVTKRCYEHGGRIACGSSVTAAVVAHAGTMGCLVTDGDGDLCGLTNNHVTGGCNHMPAGMPVIAPSPIDASPNAPEPRTIGRHKRLLPLDSGNPQAVRPQEFDVATFKIGNADLVSSMQGDGQYDTPTGATRNLLGVRVKKIGRTSGLTSGECRGTFVDLIPMPYRSQHFNATVYLSGMYGVVGDNGEPFSEGGDSGSLVVTEDGSEAIGLIVGGMGTISIVMPLDPVLSAMGLQLVAAHNV